MPSKNVVGVLHSLAVTLVIIGCAPAGDGDEAAADAQDPGVAMHIEAARELAGNDVMEPYNFFCIPGNSRPNNSSAPELEPVQIFDNLYAVGNSETIVHAITTSDGIILIDSGYGDRVESVVVPGLIALGLDPADVEYILLGHGHGDHYGGAAYFQRNYGTHVVTTAADWDTIAEREASAQPNDPPAPTKDMTLREGLSLSLGGTTITPVEIPGHTPGALAYIFPVFDNGVRHVAGLFGGTILGVDRITTPGLQQYVDSIAHYLEVAERMGVDVEVQNHAIFDDTPGRLAALAARRPGEPHPFVMGTDRYLRFWKIISECIQAEIVRRGDAA